MLKEFVLSLEATFQPETATRTISLPSLCIPVITFSCVVRNQPGQHQTIYLLISLSKFIYEEMFIYVKILIHYSLHLKINTVWGLSSG